MKFIYLALVSALLGLVWRVADVSGSVNPGRSPAISEVPDGAGSLFFEISKTNEFFAADEFYPDYCGVKQYGGVSCEIVPPPGLDASGPKK